MHYGIQYIVVCLYQNRNDDNMCDKPYLIVMLTYNDMTVENAYEIFDLCKENNIKYMPFVGKVTERPSILEGEASDMIKEANEYINKGA